MELWTAFPKKDLMMELFLAEQNLDNKTEQLWNSIKIKPEVWACFDVIEDNFWVVALTGNYIVWYNDIEEGFSISKFVEKGKIKQYQAIKNDLNTALIKLLNHIQ